MKPRQKSGNAEAKVASATKKAQRKKSVKVLIPDHAEILQARVVVSPRLNKKLGFKSLEDLVPKAKEFRMAAESLGEEKKPDVETANQWKNPVSVVKAVSLGGAMGIWWSNKSSVGNCVGLMLIAGISGVKVGEVRESIAAMLVKSGEWVRPKVRE